MKINLITKTYNNAWLLPYFFRHYNQFVTSYYVWDNMSTDGTREMLEQNPNVTIFNNYDTEFDDYKHRAFKNEAWKEFKNCDWIINCDIDEFLYLPNIKEFLELELNNKVEILQSFGFQMFSDSMPILKGQIYEEINKGVRDDNYDKPIIFSPSIEPCFSFGAHKIEPNNFKFGFKGIKLLHYKFIGTQAVKELLSRNERLSERNKAEGLSLWPEEKGHRFNPNEYYEFLKNNLNKVV